MRRNVSGCSKQAELDRTNKEKIIMKITGVLVDILVKMAPDKYQGYVVLEHGLESDIRGNTMSNLWND